MKLRTFIGKFLLNRLSEDIEIRYINSDRDWKRYTLNEVLYRDSVLDKRVLNINVLEGYLCIWLEQDE